MSVSKKVKHSNYVTQQLYSQINTDEKRKHKNLHMDVHSSIIAKKETQPKYPSAKTWIKNVAYPYNGMIFGNEKKQSTNACCHMEEPL